jgi:alanine racemase
MINCRPTRAYIDLAALKHNLQLTQNYAPNSKILAIVKANGYGHGAITIARALAGQVQGFGVACLAEALILRQAGIKEQIVVLEGFFKADELAAIAEQEIDIVIHSFAQIAMLNSVTLSKAIQVWLKVDTGMHRLGFTLDEVWPAHQALSTSQNVNKPIHWMTHFSDADDLSSNKTQQQLQRFQQLIPKDFPGLKTMANSAGIIGWPNSQADYVRPGIMLYGVSPLLGKQASDFNLKPVMTLSTELIAVKRVAAGEGVGYGSEGLAKHARLIGIAAIGYGDGYPLHAKSGTPVLVNGQRTQLVGRVSMDMLAVDLTHLPLAKISDPVVLWGKGLPIEEVAVCASTIPYELFCSVSRRVEFSIRY